MKAGARGDGTSRGKRLGTAGGSGGSPIARGHAVALVTVLIWAVTFVSTKVLLEAFRACGNPFLPLRHGLFSACCSKASTVVGSRFRRGALVYRGRRYGRHAVLPVGEYCAHVRHGIDRRRRGGGSAPVHRFAFGGGFQGAVARALLLRLLGGHGGRVFGQFRRRGGASGGCRSEGRARGGCRRRCACPCGRRYMGGLLLVSKKISTFGYDSVLATRRTFAWGLALMVPTLPLLGFSPDWPALLLPQSWANLAFLGLGASALCFVTWNVAVRELGPVRTSLYIYLVPTLTVMASAVVLGDPLTPPVLVGVLLTVVGLFLSERGK